MNNRYMSGAPACFIGLISFIAAAVLFFIRPVFAILVLSVFIVLCLTAPFLPGTGIFLPVIRRGSRRHQTIAITFDDGPDPRTTPMLLKVLAERDLPATFFVIGGKAQKHPDIINAILNAGHCIGNHTYKHDVLVMLKSGARLAREIDDAQEILKTFGIQPLIFRPPAGVVNPRLGPLLSQRGMSCVHFSCRAPDMGNRRIRGMAGKILKKIEPGDIVLLHDSYPDSGGFQARLWLAEIEKILDGFSEKGLRVVPLSDLIRRPVMKNHF